MKLLISALLFASIAISADAQEVPVRGETPFPSENNPVYTDQEPARVLIDPSLRGKVVGKELTFKIQTEGFTYAPDDATSLPVDYANGKRFPNSGHFHVYATLRGEEFNKTNVFLGAPAFTYDENNELNATIEFPVEGTWLIYVMAQYDDHTPRIPRHPQQWPTIDSVEVTVEEQRYGRPILRGVYALLGKLWGLR